MATEGSEKNRKRGACKLKEKMLLGNRRGWGWQREPGQGGRQGVGEASEKVLTVPSQIGEPWWCPEGSAELLCFGEKLATSSVVEPPDKRKVWDMVAGRLSGPETRFPSACNTPPFFFLIFIYFNLAQLVKNPPATRETQVQSMGGEDPLEEGRATHSSILAWRLPWTEEPGGATAHAVQRVGRD